MKNLILITSGLEGSLDSVRAKAVFDLSTRLETLEDHEYKIPCADREQIIHSVSKLNGRFSFDARPDKIAVKYIPSSGAKKQLMDPSVNKDWDESIIKKQQKNIRMTPGAIFRFPVEDGNGTIDAFITDWSPFPAAAAIAVHKDHPAIALVKKDETNYFTGLFVRHPLTGDMLPVFVADWVKPEFGTGAVIVNPAHNQADLDFARKIGLPVRFGLIPHDVTSDPATWPDAPVIKTGHTAKTGRFDNLIPEEAVDKYFNELHEFGHADKVTDIGIGAYPIFELEVSDTGDYVFNTVTGELKGSADENMQNEVRVKLHSSPVFSAIAAMEPGGEVEIVSQAGEVGYSLLFARCLFYDLYETALIPRRITQIQRVEEAKSTEGIDPAALRLAVTVQAPNNQPAVLKKQIIEQVERFVKNHLEMKHAFETATPEEKEVNRGQYAKIKNLIVNANYQTAFNSLYSIQKNLYQGVGKGTVDVQAVKLYFALTYVLLGDDCPGCVKAVDEWNNMEA